MKIIKSAKSAKSIKSICLVFVKIDMDLIKIFTNLLTLYSVNSINFNAEFPTLMRLCLFQGYIR